MREPSTGSVPLSQLMLAGLGVCLVLLVESWLPWAGPDPVILLLAPWSTRHHGSSTFTLGLCGGALTACFLPVSSWFAVLVYAGCAGMLAAFGPRLSPGWLSCAVLSSAACFLLFIGFAGGAAMGLVAVNPLALMTVLPTQLGLLIALSWPVDRWVSRRLGPRRLRRYDDLKKRERA